jgi:GGDEF domain-containing protein
VKDRRVLLGLSAALLGGGLAVAAAVWDVVALAVIAGALCLAGSVAIVRLVNLIRSREARIDELESRVEDLRRRAQKEAEARETVETAFTSRVLGRAVHRGELGHSLIDPATGLYSEAYFSVAFEARIAAARRDLKPVAIALVEVMSGLDRGVVRPADPGTIGASITATVREIDTACRLVNGGFALILEDTPETGAIWTVERVRRHLTGRNPGLTMWAGIACYPAHGFEPEDLLTQAERALDHAREWRQDRIEVATTPVE